MSEQNHSQKSAYDQDTHEKFSTLSATKLKPKDWKLLLIAAACGAFLGLTLAAIQEPTYVAKTLVISPQQQQNSSAAALASLGALSGLAGVAGMKSPSDQYVALMRSARVSNHIVEKFELTNTYNKKTRSDAIKTLEKRVQITIGRRDGMLGVEVEDTNPQRAADIANEYIAQLRVLTSEFALTEAQQRRKLFQERLEQARTALASAQSSLEQAGFNPRSIKIEPKASAEIYSKLKAEITASEAALSTLRQVFSDSSSEVVRMNAKLAVLKNEIRAIENPSKNTLTSETLTSEPPNYIGKLREFKYQEALFEILGKQYEMAKLDESKEGLLIQVVDAATKPERKHQPIFPAWCVGGLLVGIAAAFARIKTRKQHAT